MDNKRKSQKKSKHIAMMKRRKFCKIEREKKLNKIKMMKMRNVLMLLSSRPGSCVASSPNIFSLAHSLLLVVKIMLCLLNFLILIVFFSLSFSCFAVDRDQFTLLVERDPLFKGATVQSQQEIRRKSLNLDIEQYFADGYYVCPNEKCDRK